MSSGAASYLWREARIPGHEVLARIQRAENVRIDWLLTGTEPPYLVSQPPTDADAAALLGALLDDEPAWQLHVVVAAPRLAVVLTQPAQLDVGRGRTVEYTACEIIAGELGPAARRRIAAEIGRRPCVAHIVDTDAWHRLAAGHCGTYELAAAGRSSEWPASVWSRWANGRERVPDAAQAYMREVCADRIAAWLYERGGEPLSAADAAAFARLTSPPPLRIRPRRRAA